MPENAGLARGRLEDLKGGDAEANAAALRAVLDGAQGSFRDIVVLNAAAALVVAGVADQLAGGAAKAAAALDDGRARGVLAELVRLSNTAAPDG